MIQVYIDADGCPVKDEVYKVAARYQLKVYVVANQRLRVPLDPLIEVVVVTGDFDAADNWIAERVGSHDLVVTADIPLADRSLKKGAMVLDPKGVEFTEDNIGSLLASRELMGQLRDLGIVRGGPSSRTKKDGSQFLSSMDRAVQKLKRRPSGSHSN